MRVELVGGRHHPFEPGLDRRRIAARRHAGAVRHPEDMRVDGDGRLAEGDVEHHIGGLAADARQGLQRLARPRHRAAMLGDELLRQRHDVLRLGAVEADGADQVGRPRPRRAPPSSPACRRGRRAPASPC